MWVTLAAAATGQQYLAPGLINGNRYKFRIAARNVIGYSPYTTDISVLCATISSTPVAPVTRMDVN